MSSVVLDEISDRLVTLGVTISMTI